MSERLPVYRVESQEVSLARLIDLGKRLFELNGDFKLSETENSHILRSGDRVVDMSTASGGIWAADESQLWKPSVKAELLEENDVLAKASDFIAQGGLMPELEDPFRFAEPVLGGTYFALMQDGQRENRRLDVQVIYPIMVGDFPIVGGGGDFTLTFGHQASLIGFSGVWRSAKEAFDADVISREQADEQFRQLTANLKIDSFEALLAYYAAPAFQKQEFLYPVYVYRATAIFDDHRVPLRQIILPATNFGPPIQFQEPQPPRKKVARPRMALNGKRSYALRAFWNPWEAGTSWIGQSGGLPGSQANAQGFVDEWDAAGWNINFNWGDANAWESDWRRNDDTWVDNADFVFYTGHASMDGWVLANPDDGFLHFTEVGAGAENPGDLWGQNDLEWAAIAACGPLQDDILSPGGGDVLDRWDGAFDGMHILLGYGAVTFDNTDEGRKLAQYAKGGSTLIDAWFRTAKEVQPATNGTGVFPDPTPPDGPTVYVGAMWVGNGNIDPVNDHAWGHGSVSADPKSPNWYAAMWTTC